MEGIIYAFVDEEGSLIISTSLPGIVGEGWSYREEMTISKAGVEVLFDLLTRAAEHRNEAEESIREACPAERIHSVYRDNSSYEFCPRCGQRLLS